MKISTKGRYALRMMYELALRKSEGFISLKDIATRQQISKKYLEQIVPLFYQSGFLTASRGAGGGYRLAKAPRDYTVLDILNITEGALTPVECAVDSKECPRADACATRFVWEGLYRAMTDYLGGVTLQDIVDRAQSDGGYTYMI